MLKIIPMLKYRFLEVFSVLIFILERGFGDMIVKRQLSLNSVVYSIYGDNGREK